MRLFFATLFCFRALADAQVLVTHVYNVGNTSANLCPGLEIAITGSNLGGSGGPTTVTIGGEQATIIQPGSGTVFAVIPSDLPIGASTVTVGYNGQTSPPFAITLVAYAPAIAQVNSAYFFPTCQCFGSPLNSQPPGISAATPALPGSQVGSFVVGLGANPAAIPTVTVEGQPALGVSVQQDGDYSAYSDVIFTVPNGLVAGGQAVVISIGGVSAPAQTLYIGVVTPAISAIENSATGKTESTTHPAAPNSIVSVYATNAGNTTAVSSTYPTTSVQGVQVLVNGTAVPIYALIPSSNQINVQLPSELATSGTAAVTVQTGSATSASFTIGLGPADVGIFRIANASYPHNGAIQIANTIWDAMPAALAASYGLPACTGLSVSTLCGQPAHPGDNIVVYWTGGGPTIPSLPTGQVAPANGSTLYKTAQIPTVAIGGIPTTVSFSGIAPGSAGEYQLNLTIPASVAIGDQVPLVVTMGSSSDTVTVAIAHS
jgi:uncharacterized protein (TIGR03437 family)